MRNPLVWPHESRGTASVRGTPAEARELCKRALQEVLQGRGTDANHDGSRLDVACQIGGPVKAFRTGGITVGIRFTFSGGEPTHIAISIPSSYPGTLSRRAQELRDAAARDVAAWLSENGGMK